MEKFTRKIGSNRGKPRLWLEGAILQNAGFTHHTHWTLTQSEDQLDLKVDPEGKRKVSGKPDRPVIDIAGSSLGNIGAAEVVVIFQEPGHLTVRPQ